MRDDCDSIRREAARRQSERLFAQASKPVLGGAGKPAEWPPGSWVLGLLGPNAGTSSRSFVCILEAFAFGSRADKFSPGAKWHLIGTSSRRSSCSEKNIAPLWLET